jgi:hypothetical protein
MDRRGFIGRLSTLLAAPFIVNAELFESASPKVVLPVAGPTLLESGNIYRYIRAHKPLRLGDIVCIKDGEPFGVAVSDIDAGNYGFVQTKGPAEVAVDASN